MLTVEEDKLGARSRNCIVGSPEKKFAKHVEVGMYNDNV